MTNPNERIDQATCPTAETDHGVACGAQRIHRSAAAHTARAHPGVRRAQICCDRTADCWQGLKQGEKKRYHTKKS